MSWPARPSPRLLAGLLRGAGLCALGLLACSGGERFRSRPVRLVSRHLAVDASLAEARAAAAEADYPRAEAALDRVLREHPDDPLAPVARLFLARLRLAQDDLASAERHVQMVQPGDEPVLRMQRDAVLGLLAARRHQPRDGLVLLRALAGRMIERGQTAEVDCALADLEALGGDPGRALRALARTEALAQDGVYWLPTGLACDQLATRTTSVEALLSRVEAPADLAAVLDALPADSTLRRPVALRLRSAAETRHETARWLHWLADLPDDEATLLPVADSQGPPPFVLGLLVPLSGPRVSLGIEVTRAVQMALEGIPNVRLVAEDEGDTDAGVLAAMERLAGHQAAAVVGPTQEELARAVTPRAEALRIDLYLVAPPAAARAGGRVHLAAPSLEERVQALAHAARRMGPRVVVRLAPGPAAGDFAAATRSALEALPMGVLETGTATDPSLVLGAHGREARADFAERAARAPQRWLFDARSALAGSPGTWVGLRAGPGFEAFLAHHCERAGEPPGEVGLLAYDAARAALVAARPGTAGPDVLRRPWEILEAAVDGRSSEVPAAARTCPVATR